MQGKTEPINRKLPISNLNLIQEIYWPDEWKMLVCCMFLNLTKRAQVDKIRDKFFELYPTAAEASLADADEMSAIIQPLGFRNRRTSNIIRMSIEYIKGDWKNVSELKGIGKYAQDSHRIFMEFDMTVEPEDGVLKKYMKWRLEHEKQKDEHKRYRKRAKIAAKGTEQ